MKYKLLFLSFLFLLFLFFNCIGCKNNPIKPSDYTEKEINKKYPYWQIGVKGFVVNQGITNYASITVKEKRYLLTSLALMRTVINTAEFDEALKSNSYNSSENVSAGFGYDTTIGSVYNNDRILEVIKNFKYDVWYVKATHTGMYATANLGPHLYALWGFTNIGNPNLFVGIPNMDWETEFSLGLSPFMAVIFHEHLHNMGFNHVSGYDTPSAIQIVAQGVGNRILGGDLKDKYQKQYEELRAYYYTKYKSWLLTSTIHNP